jgi:hypothetical protein
MGGKVVASPPSEHYCAPGWTRCQQIEDGGCFPAGSYYAIPPAGWDYPKGTVWECECGRTWVSTGPPSFNSPGLVDFRPERRRERRRRERGRNPHPSMC